MSAPSKINKENFRLLDLSSDEESEDLQLEIIPSRKKKISRRERSRGSAPQASEPNIGREVQCALWWAARGTLLLWLLMLTWICAGLYDRMSTMNINISQVSRNNDVLNDQLQVCHTTKKEMEAAIAELNSRLEKLERDHMELVTQVNEAKIKFASVADQLSAAPKLADTPRRLAELQRTVADIGSQINGFDGSINSAKKQVVTAVSGVEEMRTLLHQLDARTNDTMAQVTATVHRDDELKSELLSLNTTLTAKVDNLQNRIQELSKPPSTPAPTAAAVTKTSSALPSTNVTAAPATTSPPGPVKPPVLQTLQ